MRIAELNESSYCYRLWDHRPLTDFWQIGPGKANRLQKNYMFTMGEVAQRSVQNEEWFYKEFGIDGEILIDHAWGMEPVTIRDIKSFKPERNSLSNGQVLPRPYHFEEARLCDYAWIMDTMCQCVKYEVPFHFKQTGANFKRGDRIYRVPRKDQHEQAAKAKIDYMPQERFRKELYENEEQRYPDLYQLSLPL